MTDQSSFEMPTFPHKIAQPYLDFQRSAIFWRLEKAFFEFFRNYRLCQRLFQTILLETLKETVFLRILKLTKFVSIFVGAIPLPNTLLLFSECSIRPLSFSSVIISWLAERPFTWGRIFGSTCAFFKRDGLLRQSIEIRPVPLSIPSSLILWTLSSLNGNNEPIGREISIN